MSNPAQGAVGAGNTDATAWLAKRLKAARSDSEAHPEGHSNRAFYDGQAIAYENVLSLLEHEKPATPRTDSDEGRAGAILAEACKPWEHYSGEPPDDGSPLSGVFVAGMVYTERLLAKLLDVTHYEGGDGSEDFDSDATQTLRNILTGARLWDADENRPISASPAQPAGAVPDSLRADLMHACYGVHDEPDLNRKSVRISCLNEDGALAVRNWLLDLRDGISTHLPGRNAETDALVDRFAVALKVKLRAAEAKYDWQNGWIKDDWRVECQRGLLLHIGKGDPLDVAAYAAFCWHHGWSTSSQRSTEFVTGAVEPTAAAIAAYAARYPDGALSETSDHAIECWNRVAVAACLAGQSTGQGADLRKTLTLIREFAGSSILVRNDALDHIYVVASKALDPNSPIPEPVGKPDSASDSLRSLSEGDRDLLNSVLDWLRGVCPCGNAGPAQCPVCGARIDDETGFCAIDHRCKIPAHLLGRIETALGIASHPAGQSAGSGETIAVQKRDLVKMVDAAFAVDPSVPTEAQGDNLFAAATKLASYLPLGLECTGCGSRESIEAIQARGFSSCCPERKMQPAPDSTRTGQGEDAADLIRQVDAILRKPPEPVSHPSEAWCDDYADWHDAYVVARSKALAARPAAPEAK